MYMYVLSETKEGRDLKFLVIFLLVALKTLSYLYFVKRVHYLLMYKICFASLNL